MEQGYYRIVGEKDGRYCLVDKNVTTAFDQIGTAQEVWLYDPQKGTGLTA